MATTAFARSCATTTSRRWRPSCGGPWGRASGTTSSCSGTSAAPTSALPRVAAGQGPERDVPGGGRGCGAHRQPARLRQPALEAARPPRQRRLQPGALPGRRLREPALPARRHSLAPRLGRPPLVPLRQRREDGSEQPADHAAAGVQEEAQQAGVPRPWWDLQLGISINQFLSIFAAKNTDFRNRAFTFLFADGANADGANEELSSLQAHAFPHHFADMKKKVGLAPAANVSARGSDSSVLKSVDANRPVRSNYPLIAAKKFSGEKDENLAAHGHGGNSMMNENNNPDVDGYISNPYLSIAMARDSLRQREEAKKKQAELTELENEATEMQQKNEEERVAIQDLEAQLIKRRRRVEKCRRLADAQANYKTVLEKMIRDAMHHGQTNAPCGDIYVREGVVAVHHDNNLCCVDFRFFGGELDYIPLKATYPAHERGYLQTILGFLW